MSPFKLGAAFSLRSVLFFVFLLLLLGAVACGTTAPTPPASPTLSAALQPTARPQPTSTLQPTATLAPLPTVGAPLPTVTPTVTATVPATRTVVRTTRPAATAAPTGAAPRPAATTGRIAYSVVTDAPPRFHGIWAAKTDGSAATKLLEFASWPSISPDGKSLAFFQLPGGGKSEGLYVADAFGGNPVPVVIHPGACCFNWSPDGKWVVYTISNKINQPGGGIFKVLMDGSYQTKIPLGVDGNGPSFSPDGRQVFFSGCLLNTNTCGVQAVSADGGSPRKITEDNGGNARLSPRGDKLVYQSRDGTGHMQVWVANADGSGKKQLTNGKSNDGQPVWSRDGGSIFWRSDQNGSAWAIYVMNADGSNQRRVINNVPPDPNLWGWESLSVGP